MIPFLPSRVILLTLGIGMALQAIATEQPATPPINHADTAPAPVPIPKRAGHDATTSDDSPPPLILWPELDLGLCDT